MVKQFTDSTNATHNNTPALVKLGASTTAVYGLYARLASLALESVLI